MANVRELPLSSGTPGSVAVYGADLVPCDPETKAPADPMSVVAIAKDEASGRDVPKYAGCDELYLAGWGVDGDGGSDGGGCGGEVGRFQLRITVSRASAGLAAKAYHEALFARRKELGDEGDDGADEDGGSAAAAAALDVDRWADEDEELGRLRQGVVDAASGAAGGSGPLGYYVEVMLVEPGAGSDEVVVPPPPDLDRGSPGSALRPSASRSLSSASFASSSHHDGGEGGSGGGGGVFRRNLYTSAQFGSAPGPWEKLNVKAFGEVALDVRKALVRVEFPSFPEGCRDKTFREIYQLNARVSFAGRRKGFILCVYTESVQPSVLIAADSLVPRHATQSAAQIRLLRNRVPRHPPGDGQKDRSQVRPAQGPAPQRRRRHLRRGPDPVHAPAPLYLPADRLLRGAGVLLPRDGAHVGGGPLRSHRDSQVLHGERREGPVQEDAREPEVLPRELGRALRHEAEELAPR